MNYLNYFTFLLLSSLFSNCSNNPTKHNLAIMALVSEISDSYSDGRIEKQVTKYKIAYFKDYVLYEVGTVRYSVKTTIFKGEINNEMRPTNDTTYNYFIIEKNRDIGFVYDSLRAGNKKQFKLDSLKIDLGINAENFGVYGVALGSPIRSRLNAKTKKIEFEAYDSKKLENDADTVFRFYDDRMKKFDFSFSPTLDKQKGSKLVKTHFIYLKKKPTDSKIYVKRIDFVDYIEEIKVNYSKDLINLFEQFKKDSHTLDLK